MQYGLGADCGIPCQLIAHSMLLFFVRESVRSFSHAKVYLTLISNIHTSWYELYWQKLSKEVASLVRRQRRQRRKVGVL